MRSIILHIGSEDLPYLPQIKPILAGRAQTAINQMVPGTVTEMVMAAETRGAKAVVSTSLELLRLLQPNADRPKIDDYAGSLIKHRGIEFLFIDPLKQLVTVPHAKFVLRRFLDKVLAPEGWLVPPPFKWELFTPSRLEILYEFFSTCDLIAEDIETTIGDPERSIQCAGFCGIRFGEDKNNCTVMNVVVPMDSEYNATVVRLFNMLPAAKAFQNGKYDHAYFLRYGSPVTNYSFDTINLFHSWYSELPKDLGFISAFTVREYCFHKNDGKTGNKMDYYEYNAKDVYYTLFATLSMLQEIPNYAERNYLLEFPLVFPCILSEHTGLKLSPERIKELKTRVELQIENRLTQVQKMVACPTFNPGSWQQTQRLFAMLGSGDIKSTDKAAQDKVSSRHPLNKLLIEKISKHREDAKLNGSYFKDGVNWLGRCFYALNPHATDTGRLASRESQFWCGLQIQNIKRDDDTEDGISAKEMFIADDGFYYGEADYSQNEARGTAYLSGDTGLIGAVDDTTKDFHGQNASKFFGIPYEEIVRSTPIIDEDGNILEWVHKTLQKALRDLSKRTNHGANYNMGPGVMLETMGIEKVLKAKELLGLPKGWGLIKVTTHLLAVFAKTYPILKGPWYDKIVNDVESTGFLVGPTGWTRRSFLAPRDNKRHLNSLVAHPPQSLGAMVLNKAYLKVFYKVWMPNQMNFKLHAQIHDSILFSYRIGHKHLAFQVAECMKIPVQVTDTFGKTRTLTVPVDLKGGSNKWTELEPLKKSRKLLLQQSTVTDSVLESQVISMEVAK